MAKLKPKPTTPEPPTDENGIAEYKSLDIPVANIPVTLEMVRKHLAPTATPGELFMFMGIARSLGLNPFEREIYYLQEGLG